MKKIYPTVTSVCWHPPRWLEHTRIDSFEEARYAQTFSEDYLFPPQKTKKWKLLGEAFPPKMAEYIANKIPLKKGRFVDLFCGIGGWTQGLKKKFTPILAIDIEPLCCEYYKLNHPKVDVVCQDILTLDSLPSCEIIVGSPPCQEFSILRKAVADNTEKGITMPLTQKFYELVRKSDAKYYFYENVPSVQKTLGRGQIIRMKEYGVPQKRVRLIDSNLDWGLQKTLDIQKRN